MKQNILHFLNFQNVKISDIIVIAQKNNAKEFSENSCQSQYPSYTC